MGLSFPVTPKLVNAYHLGSQPPLRSQKALGPAPHPALLSGFHEQVGRRVGSFQALSLKVGSWCGEELADLTFACPALPGVATRCQAHNTISASVLLTLATGVSTVALSVNAESGC